MASPDANPGDCSAFRWLRTGEEGLETMLLLMDAAARSIRLETYIFGDSAVGRRFLEALARAASRGVKVRVLIDSVGSLELPDSFWDPLRQAGGEVRWFNPLALERISYRDHRKALVVDDVLAVVGGFNIAEEYHGDGVRRGWRDLGMEIRGVLAVELAESVDAMFSLAEFRHKRLHRLRKGGTVSAAAEQNWRLLLSGPGRGHRALKRAVARDVARSADVVVMSAYFLPTWRIRRELRRVARRGGRARLILAAKSDVLLAQLASRRLYQGFLKAGVEIYEYLPQVLHAKLILADDVVYAGSANLDARGLGINYELLVSVSSPELAAEGRGLVAEILTHCRRIHLDEWRRSRGLFQRLMEALSFLILARLDPYLARWQWQRWWQKRLTPRGARRRRAKRRGLAGSQGSVRG